MNRTQVYRHTLYTYRYASPGLEHLGPPYSLVIMETQKWYDFFFGDVFRHRFERLTIIFAVAGFSLHLLLIGAFAMGWLPLPEGAEGFFRSPVSALYTPFSFILIYEVYLLIAVLPQSFSSAIQKQYEIIGLIFIRRIFKDISHLNLEKHGMMQEENYHLLVDIGIFLVLFFFTFLFMKMRKRTKNVENEEQYRSFIRFKKWISIAMMPVMLGLVIYEFGSWIAELQKFSAGLITELTDVNEIFYHDFFMVLICVDVFILLISFRYIQSYQQLIRNSGYIVSTVLIRLSFTAEGWYHSLLILLGVVFGVALLAIYNLVRQQEDGAEQVKN